MVWYDVKRAALQRMFAMTGNEIVRDNSNAQYLVGMPAAANEGMRLLAAAGRGIVKCCEILHCPPENLLRGNGQQGLCSGGGKKEVSFGAMGAQAAWFEILGCVRITVSVYAPQEQGGELLSQEEKQLDAQSLTRHSLLFDNPGAGRVELVFSSLYGFTVRGAAMYAAAFAHERDVPQGGGEVRIALRQRAEDFSHLLASEMVFEDAGGALRRACFRLEGEDVLVLSRRARGVYRVWYSARPPVITHSTNDDFEIPLGAGQGEMLALYMAAQLYKDDDLAVAASYRNEFDAGLARLVLGGAVAGREEFESGWI